MDYFFSCTMLFIQLIEKIKRLIKDRFKLKQNIYDTFRLICFTMPYLYFIFCTWLNATDTFLSDLLVQISCDPQFGITIGPHYSILYM